jgi:hypothetical protein
MVLCGFLFLQLLSTHMLAQKADGLYSGGSTWGDRMVPFNDFNFAQRGSGAVRKIRFFQGTSSLSLVPDLVSMVSSERAESSSELDSAFTEHSGFVAALYLLRMVGANALGSVSSILLVLFNGSIVGIFIQSIIETPRMYFAIHCPG